VCGVGVRRVCVCSVVLDSEGGCSFSFLQPCRGGDGLYREPVSNPVHVCEDGGVVPTSRAGQMDPGRWLLALCVGKPCCSFGCVVCWKWWTLCVCVK